MTEWMSGDRTRHIPEDELHAYLDQALSRSQCVEIECHLAECRRCAGERDSVAAVRDRITALLAEVAPRNPGAIPAFDELVNRHRALVASRRAILVRAARFGTLAASLVGALLAGWWSRGLVTQRSPDLGGPGAAIEPAAEATIEPGRRLIAVGGVDTVDAAATQPLISAPPVSAERERGTNTGVALVRAVAEEPLPLAVQVTSSGAVDDAPGFSFAGLWQSVDWFEAWDLTGGNLPRIEGLPVLDVQVQPAAGDARPIVVVAQQHPSGRVIRTIEGPVERVAALMEHQVGSGFNASAASFTPSDYVADGAGAARRGLRILTVTGTLPADSLNALARNIAMRQ
jgi:hypothetical protein